jgi:nitrogen fixation/metabolism regulation signal transduction histidine kinase
LTPSAAAPAAPKFKRSARNYLLDSHFQLKYTSYIVGLTVAISLALGAILYVQTTKTVALGNELYEQSAKTLEISSEAVRIGKAATAAGDDSIKQANALKTNMEMFAKANYGDQPLVLESVASINKEQIDAITKRAAELEAGRKALEEQNRLLLDQEKGMRDQHVAIERQRKMLFVSLAGVLTLLVVLVGIAGIIFTHRVAGPIFKMKRLLREVGEGKLVLQGRLRKGDELQDFFEVFATMVEKLRERQAGEIATIDATIAEAKSKDTDAALVAKLETLRSSMQAELDAK